VFPLANNVNWLISNTPQKRYNLGLINVKTGDDKFVGRATKSSAIAGVSISNAKAITNKMRIGRRSSSGCLL